jgi:hypothetical protein
MSAPYPTELERRLKAAYGNHKHIAIKRGIPFLFAFEQWSEWWLTTIAGRAAVARPVSSK